MHNHDTDKMEAENMCIYGPSVHITFENNCEDTDLGSASPCNGCGSLRSVRLDSSSTIVIVAPGEHRLDWCGEAVVASLEEFIEKGQLECLNEDKEDGPT